MTMENREPSHYLGDGEVTCSRALASMCAGWDRAAGDADGVSEVCYWLCAGLKYIWRWPLKDDPGSDLRKAVDCVERALAAWTGEGVPDGTVWVVDGRTGEEVEAGADDCPLAVFETSTEAFAYLRGIEADGGEGIAVPLVMGDAR